MDGHSEDASVALPCLGLQDRATSPREAVMQAGASASTSAPAAGGGGAEPEPWMLNASQHGPGLEVGPGQLDARYLGDGRHANDVGAVQAARPAPTDVELFYFEVTVVDQGELGRVAVGLTPKDANLSRQPG